MAIAVVQTSAEGRQAGVSSVTSAFASNPGSGNKLVAYVAMWNSGSAPTGTVTDNFGNTWTRRSFSSSGNARLEIWEAPVTSTGGSFTLTLTSSLSNSEMNLIAVEISGAGSFDQQATFSNAGAATSTAIGPTGTLATAESFVATIIASDSGPSAAGWTVPSGYTSVSLQNDSGSVIAYGAARFITSATTAITPSWSHVNFGNRVALVAVFSDPGGAAPDMPESIDEDAEDGSLSHWFGAYRARTFGAYYTPDDAANNTRNVFTNNTTFAAQATDTSAGEIGWTAWLGSASPLAYAVYYPDWNGEPLADDAGVATANLSASQTLDNPTQATSLQVFSSLSASQTLALPTQAATVWNYASLTASQTLDNPTQSASVVTSTTSTLTAAQTLDNPTQSTAVAVRAALTAAQTLANPTQAVTVAVRASLTAAQTLANPTQTANASAFTGRSLTADQLLGVPANIFFAVATVTGSAAQTLPLPGQVLRARRIGWDADAPPPGGWSADPSDILSWLPQDPATGSWS